MSEATEQQQSAPLQGQILETVPMMTIEAVYEENLPQPNYKTMRFAHRITKQVPTSLTKEQFVAENQKLHAQCQYFVKQELAKVVASMKG